MTHLEITELLRAATKEVELAVSLTNSQISNDLNPCINNYNLILKLVEEYRTGTIHNGVGDEHAHKQWQSLELFEVELVQLISHIRTQVSNTFLKFETLPPPPSPLAGGKPA